MPYLNESGLSAYDSNLKEWVSSQESKTITSSIYPWTKTVKAGAVSCYPVGGTELRPVVDFLFKEVGPSSGTKGSDNPSTITGVSSVKTVRCGKNLFIFPKNYNKTLSNGVTVSIDSNGIITLNGTATADGYNVIVLTAPLIVTPGVSITISNTLISGTQILNQDNLSFKTQLQLKTAPTSSSYWVAASKFETATYTMQIERYVAACQIYVYSGAVFDNLKFKTQAEFGTASTDFELYSGDTYTLDLDGTYYGGTVDLSTGLMTITHINKIITGDDVGVFSAAGNCVGCRVNVGPEFIYAGTKITNKFVFNTSGNAQSEHFRALSAPLYNMIVLYVSKTRLDFSGAVDPSNPTEAEMRAAFIAWIAENSVEFCGELATPYTVQLTPIQIFSLTQADKYTPCLNTVYTDASSVQVGYVKSPIREEYELQQAIVSQGDNI